MLQHEGGDSPWLRDLLTSETFDAVVLAGISTGTYLALQALAGRCPIVLLPQLVGRPIEFLSLVDEMFASSSAVLVCTETEARWAAQRGAASRVTNVGFVLRTHELVHQNTPHGFTEGDYIAVVGDWRNPAAFREVQSWMMSLSHQLDGLAVRPLGPGASRLPYPFTTPLAEGRLDTWRWMARALAVVDPAPHQLLGQSALEALQYQVPVVVSAHGGAAREHAELGNGGIWCRSTQDMTAAIRLLREDVAVRRQLGELGRSYATYTYGNTKQFIASITDLVSSLTR